MTENVCTCVELPHEKLQTGNKLLNLNKKKEIYSQIKLK